MFYIILIILIIIIVSIFNYKEYFQPFSYGNINNDSSYFDKSNLLVYPTAFKMGEINIHHRNYDKYLNKLNNNYLNKKISKFNDSCPCQKKEN
jgi:hypothetical protein